MDIEALLCDAVTVRENLLHVLGGGLGQIWRESYPAPLGAELALLLTLHPSETADEHELRVLIQDTDGKQIAGWMRHSASVPRWSNSPPASWYGRRWRSRFGTFRSPGRASTASSFWLTSSIAAACHSRRCQQERDRQDKLLRHPSSRKTPGVHPRAPFAPTCLGASVPRSSKPGAFRRALRANTSPPWRSRRPRASGRGAGRR